MLQPKVVLTQAELAKQAPALLHLLPLPLLLSCAPKMASYSFILQKSTALTKELVRAFVHPIFIEQLQTLSSGQVLMRYETGMTLRAHNLVTKQSVRSYF